MFQAHTATAERSDFELGQDSTQKILDNNWVSEIPVRGIKLTKEWKNRQNFICFLKPNDLLTESLRMPSHITKETTLALQNKTN